MAEVNSSQGGNDLRIINEFIKMPVVSDDDATGDSTHGQFSLMTTHPSQTIDDVESSFGNSAAAANLAEKSKINETPMTYRHTNVSNPAPVISEFSETSGPRQGEGAAAAAATKKTHSPPHLRKRKRRKNSLHRCRSNRGHQMRDIAKKISSKHQQRRNKHIDARTISIPATNINLVAPPPDNKPSDHRKSATQFSTQFPTTELNLQSQKCATFAMQPQQQQQPTIIAMPTTSQNAASNLIKLASMSQNPQFSKIIHETEHLNHKVELVSKKNHKLALERERLLTTIQNTSAMLHSTVSTLGTETKDRNRSVKSSKLRLESIKQQTRRVKSSSSTDDDSGDSDSLERSTRFTIKEFDNLLTALQTKQPCSKSTKKRSAKKSAKKKCNNDGGNPDPVTDSNKPSQYDIIVQWLNNKAHASNEISPDDSSNGTASSSSSTTSTSSSSLSRLSAILPQPPSLSEVSKSDSSDKNTAQMNNFLENIKKSFVSSKEKLENTRPIKNIINANEHSAQSATLPLASSIQYHFIDQHEQHDQQSAPNMPTEITENQTTANLSPMIELPRTLVNVAEDGASYEGGVSINVTAEEQHKQLIKNIEYAEKHSAASTYNFNQPEKQYILHKHNKFNELQSVIPAYELQSSKQYLPHESNESGELVAPTNVFQQSNPYQYLSHKNNESVVPTIEVNQSKQYHLHKNENSIELQNSKQHHSRQNDESAELQSVKPTTHEFQSSKQHHSHNNDESFAPTYEFEGNKHSDQYLPHNNDEPVAPTSKLPSLKQYLSPKNDELVSLPSIAPTFEIPASEVNSLPKDEEESNFNSPQLIARTYEILTTSDQHSQDLPQLLETSISEYEKIILSSPLDLSLKPEFQKFDDRILYQPPQINTINEPSKYDVQKNLIIIPSENIEKREVVDQSTNDNDTFNLSTNLDVDEQRQTRLDQTANVIKTIREIEQNHETEMTLPNVEQSTAGYSLPAEKNSENLDQNKTITENSVNNVYGEYGVNDYERKDILGRTEDQEEDCNDASQIASMMDDDKEDKVRAAAAAEVIAPTEDKKEFLQNWLDDLKTRTRQFHESQCGSIYNINDSYKGKLLIPSSKRNTNEDEHEEFITLCKTMIDRMDSMISKPTTQDDIDSNKLSYPQNKQNRGQFTYQQRYNIIKKTKGGYGNVGCNRGTKLPRPADKYRTVSSISSDETPSSDKDDFDDKEEQNGGFRTFQKCLANLEQMNMRRTNNALTQTLIIKALRKLMAKQYTKMTKANDRDRKAAASLCAASMAAAATDADEDTDDECESPDNSPPRRAKAKIKMKHVKRYNENHHRHHRHTNINNVPKDTVENKDCIDTTKANTAFPHLDKLESHRTGHRYIDKEGGLTEENRLKSGSSKLTTSTNMYNIVNKVSKSIIYQDLDENRFGVFNQSKIVADLVNETNLIKKQKLNNFF